jgi:uncharacterized protein (DUF924 family)
MDAATAATTPACVVEFWRDAGPKAWFRRDPAFDEAIRTRFEAVHLEASRGAFGAWAADGEGALALVLLLDQFPRNLYRDSAHAFATDPLARTVAARALDQGFDTAAAPLLAPFFYMPFVHHEAPLSQARGTALFEQYAERTGDAVYLRYARLHAELIARFGRFPHRNGPLGRESTPEEIAYLEGGGFKG